MMRWCVAQTKLHEEDIAIANLKKQSFQTFFPLLREHRGKETKLVPMFPKYLFVQINIDELGWLSINSTRGIKRLLTSCIDRPSLLPEGWVEDLMGQGGVLDLFMDASAFAKGDQVEFIDGPFKGHTGVCQWSSEKRVGLLLSLLGRETMILSESRTLRLAPKREPALVR
jgi:transcriptional antiterminator RfaH